MLTVLVILICLWLFGGTIGGLLLFAVMACCGNGRLAAKEQSWQEWVVSQLIFFIVVACLTPVYIAYDKYKNPDSYWPGMRKQEKETK